VSHGVQSWVLSFSRVTYPTQAPLSSYFIPQLINNLTHSVWPPSDCAALHSLARALADNESSLPPLDAIDDVQSPPSFGVDDTIDVDEEVSEDSIRSDDMVAAASDAPPVQQWTVHKGASKRGKDMLVEGQGFSYTVGKR